MKRARRILALSLVITLLSLGMTQAQQRRTRPATNTRRPTASRTSASRTSTNRTNASRTATTTAAAPAPASSLLTGVYRLNLMRSDDPQDAAERATVNLSGDERQRVIENLTARLTSPDQLSLERRGRLVSIASTRAPRVNFEADERVRVEQAPDGHTIRTRAVLYGDALMVSTTGSRDDEFVVNFDPIDNGRGLRVTRRINDLQLNRPVLVQSIYEKVSNTARWSVYGEPETARTAIASTPMRGSRRTPPTDRAQTDTQTNTEVNSQTDAQTYRVPGGPPVMRPGTPQPRTAPGNYPTRNETVFQIGNGTQFVAVLNDYLSTAQSHEGDHFTMTVREPAPFAGARLDGHISSINRSGRIAGRSLMTLSFDRITLQDGRSASFSGYVEAVRATNGEDVRVDNESGGQVQENNNQTDRTIERTAIGAAVGAVIGAIAGGGKGAAIGAAIGAGAGAGSVYAQGREDLELARGTEVTIRSSRQ